MSNFTCEFGLLYRREVRKYLDERIQKGDDVDYKEHKFFTSSIFKIKGDYVDVESIKLKLVCWARRL